MTKNKQKIGIVGCGIITKDHLGAIKSYCNNAEIFLCDSNIEMANKWASRYPISGVFDSAEEMIKHSSLTTVHILTPPVSHKELAILSLNNGCDVFIEKPMALTLNDTEHIYDLAHNINRRVCVGHSLLYMECVRKAIGVIKSGLFGEHRLDSLLK